MAGNAEADRRATCRGRQGEADTGFGTSDTHTATHGRTNVPDVMTCEPACRTTRSGNAPANGSRSPANGPPRLRSAIVNITHPVGDAASCASDMTPEPLVAGLA